MSTFSLSQNVSKFNVRATKKKNKVIESVILCQRTTVELYTVLIIKRCILLTTDTSIILDPGNGCRSAVYRKVKSV